MFQPLISVTAVADDSSSTTVKDITGTSPDPVTGYGATPDGPANFAAVLKFFIRHTYTGEDPVVVDDADTDGTLDTGITVTFSVLDGVWLIEVFYGVEIALDYTIDGSDIVRNSGTDDWTEIFQSAWGVAQQPDTFPIEITDREEDNITLDGTPSEDDIAATVWAYYRAEAYSLVLNDAVEVIASDICNIAAAKDDCDFEKIVKTTKTILLKLAAEADFANEDYTSAHKAAVDISLLAESNPSCNC